MTLPAVKWHDLKITRAVEDTLIEEEVEAMGLNIGNETLLAIDFDPVMPASDAFLEVLDQINAAKAPMTKRDAIRIAHMGMRLGYNLGRGQLAGDDNPFRWMRA